MTSYNFAAVLHRYLAFRTSGLNAAGPLAFQDWLIHTHGHERNGAIAQCFPLRRNEFDLANASTDLIHTLANEPMSARAQQ